jgi:hypothetical protein
MNPPPPLPSDAILRAMAKRELARRHLSEFILQTFPTYQMGWFHRRLCELMDDVRMMVEKKASPRAMIFAPPRHGKTEIVTRRMLAHCIGKHPEWQLINATYGQDLSTDNARDVRRIIAEPQFQAMFPDFAMRDDSQALDRWETTAGGKVGFVGIGGALTGRGADLLIIDDPLKGRAEADSETEQKRCFEWYLSVARTRLMPGGGIIYCQTPWSLNDTSQRLLELAKAAPDADQWVVYKFPAIATEDEEFREKGEALHPERFTLRDLTATKATYAATGNMREWSALYQVNPVPEEGAYFKRADVARTYTVTPEHGEVFLALDAAVKDKEQNDNQALGAWSHTPDGSLILLPGAFIGHCDTFALMNHIFRLAKQYNARMLAAGRDHIVGSLGPFLREEMRKPERNLYFTIEELPEVGDKQRKNRSAQARSQAHRLLFPEGDQFRLTILPELLSFPGGTRDDAVDMVGNACRAAEAFFPPSLPPPPAQVSAADTPGTGAWLQAQFDKQARRGAPAGGHRPALVPGR